MLKNFWNENNPWVFATFMYFMYVLCLQYENHSTECDNPVSSNLLLFLFISFCKITFKVVLVFDVLVDKIEWTIKKFWIKKIQHKCAMYQHSTYPGFVNGLCLLNTLTILATDKQIWLLEIQIWGASWLVAKFF